MKLTSYTFLGIGLCFAFLGLVQKEWSVFFGGCGFVAGWLLGAITHER